LHAVVVSYHIQEDHLEALRNEDDFTKFSKVSKEFPVFVVNTEGRKLTLWVEREDTIDTLRVKLWEKERSAYSNESVRWTVVLPVPCVCFGGTTRCKSGLEAHTAYVLSNLCLPCHLSVCAVSRLYRC
jgi:hypothetical protein